MLFFVLLLTPYCDHGYIPLRCGGGGGDKGAGGSRYENWNITTILAIALKPCNIKGNNSDHTCIKICRIHQKRFEYLVYSYQ